MIASYFIVMLRHLRRNLLHSSINMIGLTAGISFALLIGVFIWKESQVNQSLKDVDRLFLLETVPMSEGIQCFLPMPLVPKAVEEHPEMIVSYYRFWDRNVTFSNGDKFLRIQSMIGDPSFVSTFGFDVLAGDGLTALTRPNTMIVTKQVAEQFFGTTDVVGKTLSVASEGQGLKNYEITAVIADPEKKNSVTDFLNMNAQVILSRQNKADFSMAGSDEFSWNFSGITYIKIGENTSPDETQTMLQAIIDRDAPPAVSATNKVLLKPLSDYYQMTNHGSVHTLIVSMQWIVAFILFLAIANFVNITISGSFTRLKEIGVRKAIGGVRQQVMMQCFFESTIYACLSGIGGVVTYELLHEYFAVMLGAELPSVGSFTLNFWLTIVAGILMVGILAGAYPAFYLSATRTIESLKGKFKSVSGTILFSRSLVGIQFGLSIFILASAVIISLQIDYFLSKDLGYDRSSVYVVTSAPRLWSAEGLAKMEVAKRELEACPAVSVVSLSIGSPAVQLGMTSFDIRRVGQSVDEAITADFTASDEDYADVYGLTMIAGRYFTDENGSVIPNGVVINESAQKALSLEIGDKINLGDMDIVEHPVVGIVKDFNYQTFHDAVNPVVIAHTRDALVFRFFSFKVNPGDLSASIQELEKAWRRAFPTDAFMGSFADERVEQQYKTEMSLKRASAIGSILMIIIVLTGVLGLVALTVAKRNKEIGIRKVLGASTIHLLNLLAREYVLVMCVAFVVGLPLSYWFISGWLETFVYHLELTWWMFAVPAAAIFILTLAVVAGRGLGATLANPVNSLRYE